MKKKTLFALLIAAALLLSGCSSLVMRDSAVDARQVIATVNGETVNKQEFLAVYNYNLSQEQYYAQMMAQYGLSDGSVDSAAVLQNTAQSIISNMVQAQKAQELGFDQFTDEDKAQLDEDAQTTYAQQLENVKTAYFADSEPTEEELANRAASLGYSLASARQSAESAMILDRLEASVKDTVSITEADLEAALAQKIEDAKSRYETSPAAYVTARNGSGTVYYTPAGYRVIGVIEKTQAEDAAEGAAQQEIQALADRVAAGEAFDALGEDVKTYTVYADAATPDQALVSAAMALTEVGAVTEPVATANGFAIAQYQEEIAEHTVTLDEVRDALQTEVLTTAQNDAYTAAVQSWTDASQIELNLDRLN